MGNICRSSSAEGIFRKLADDAGRSEEYEIDSAGTIGFHAGKPADSRMRAAALERGYRLDSIARQIGPSDFDEFDLIVVMDDDNHEVVTAQDPGSRAKIVRMCTYYSGDDYREVPDPYYGGGDGFYTVLDILEDACANLLKQT